MRLFGSLRRNETPWCAPTPVTGRWVAPPFAKRSGAKTPLRMPSPGTSLVTHGISASVAFLYIVMVPTTFVAALIGGAVVLNQSSAPASNGR